MRRERRLIEEGVTVWRAAANPEVQMRIPVPGLAGWLGRER